MPAPDRALIIAVENYPRAEGLANQLSGTNKAALAFYKWLREIKQIAAANILLCGDFDAHSESSSANKFGANKDDIRDAVIELAKAGRDKTGQLYVFLSGHGFGYEKSAHRKLLDIFVAADFRNLRISGDKCIRLDELSEELWMSVGGTDHFFFIDCCRNRITEASAQTGALALALDRAELGRPTKYMLYSTVSGETSLVDSKFPDALMDGLTGTGRAKQFTRGECWVLFDRLFSFTKSRLRATQDVDRSVEGEGDGRILRIPELKKTDCTLVISGCEPQSEFVLTIIKGDEATPERRFSGLKNVVRLLPSDDGYKFKITLGGRQLAQIDPPQNTFFDLYEPSTVSFQPRQSETIFESFLLPPAGVGISFGVESGGGPGSGPAPPAAASPPPVSSGRVCDSIAANFPSAISVDGRLGVDFSETLSPVTERNANLWLAWIGASRIVQPPGTYSKLGMLPLEDFVSEAPNSSVLYVLAGLDISDRIGIGVGLEPEWRTAREVSVLRGVHELEQEIPPGTQTFLSISLPNQPVSTIASFALPNRATFVVVSERERGHLDIQQFLLPIHSLRAHLNPEENEQIGQAGRTLGLVRMVCNAEEQFSRRRRIGIDSAQTDWDLLLFGKWVDPLMALMAAFEMIRLGQLHEKQQLLNVVLGNMRRYFSSVPDVAALGQVLQPMVPAPFEGVPLLREALMNVKGYQEPLIRR